MGWFYGLKLHTVVNDKGETLDFAIAQANAGDRGPLKNEGFPKAVSGKLFAGKGHISEKLTKILFVNDMRPITNIRDNMKNSLVTMGGKIMPRKRSAIETVDGELKNICQLEHSRHRPFANFIPILSLGQLHVRFCRKNLPLLVKQHVQTKLLLFD